MRAAELIAPFEFRLTEMEIDDPGPGEVQVRVEAVGVCGSDIHAYTEGAVGRNPNLYPMLLGHEPAGRIVKAGAGVTGLAAGDRGALEPALYCYHCEFCLSGHHNVCANIRFLSTPGHPGFFRELVNLPVENFKAIPAGMSYGEAALAEPLAIAIHSLRLAAIEQGRDGGGDWRGTDWAVDDCGVESRGGGTDLGGRTAGASPRAGAWNWRGCDAGAE